MIRSAEISTIESFINERAAILGDMKKRFELLTEAIPKLEQVLEDKRKRLKELRLSK